MSLASSTSGTSVPNWLVTCANTLAPMRILPRAKSTNTSTVSSAVFNTGVSVPRTSVIFENAVTIKLTGDNTSFCTSPSFQRVRMESESLPTGMPKPNCGHRSMPIAFTVSNKAASWPGVPQAAIQLALSFTSSSFSTGAANKLVILSAMAMRPEAGAFNTASGVRSPMAMAWPAYPV